MNRRNYLAAKVLQTVGEAYKEKRSRGINPLDCKVGGMAITLRESVQVYKNANGGDYDRWVVFIEVGTGIYWVEESWSCEYSISGYSHIEGYIVMTNKDFQALESLELEP